MSDIIQEQFSVSNIDVKKLQEMIFIYNALENGWRVKKGKSGLYSFKKPHNDNEEYFSDFYISTFIKENINMKKMFFDLSKEIE